jgi:hypothetical protein
MEGQMPRTRRSLIGGVLATLAIGALWAPVSAADAQGTLAFVNGIPGRTVDVCLNGKEIKTGLGYGKAVSKSVVGLGQKTLKFYGTDPRRCRGTVVAQESFTFAAGDDLTIVATKNNPRVVTFDNVGLGHIPADGPALGHGYLAWRHAAEPAVNFKYDVLISIPETPIGPSVDPVWVKGDEVTSPTGTGTAYNLKATRPETSQVIASRQGTPRNEHRLEWILVGSTERNARFVFLDRKISGVAP